MEWITQIWAKPLAQWTLIDVLLCWIAVRLIQSTIRWWLDRESENVWKRRVVSLRSSPGPSPGDQPADQPTKPFSLGKQLLIYAAVLGFVIWLKS